MWKRTASLLAGLLMAAILAAPAAAVDPMPPAKPAPSTSVPAPPPMGRPFRGGPVAIQLDSLQLEATVDNGVAHVRSEQRFVNRTQAPAEGTYVFPLPQGATVSSFQMFVDGEAYSAEVLTADKARDIYESIVQRNRDPALLQYIGQGLLQARIFPVPAGAERRIKVEYDQVLPRDGGLAELTLPISADTVPQASISVNLKDLGSGTAYSPTHNVAVTRNGNGATVSYEGAQARGDFKLFFGQESDKLGVNLLSYKSGSEDGYFMLLVNPPTQQTAAPIAKDVILALDLSGSMEGEKFTQAKGAALQILGSLGKDDRFGVVGFESDVRTYADELRGAADAANAMEYVRNLHVGGATNLSGAITRAQELAGKNAGRPQVIILLTDGQPTAGETYPERIISNVRNAATGTQRIFTFGVGYDVNTLLLDGMAQENRGRSDYVKPGENLESAVSTFWRKVGQPVLSDVTLKWDGVTVDQTYPRPIADLYLGSQMVLLGRYRQGSKAAGLTVSGKVNGETRTYNFNSLTFTDKDAARDYIPRLWANRKVGYLLGEIQRNGQNKESIDEVVALSQRFGIATPYTSFFVNEPGTQTPQAATPPRPTPDGGRDLGFAPAGSAQAQKAADSVLQKVAAAPASGSSAVQNAQTMNDRRDAKSVSETQAPAEAAGQMRTAGDKTFILKQGVWVDTAYQGSDLLYLKLGSDRYLELARTRPDLAKYLAVGSPLIFVDGKTAYGVDIPGKEESNVALPAAAASTPGGTAKPALWIGSGLAAVAAAAGVFTWRRRRSHRQVN